MVCFMGILVMSSKTLCLSYRKLCFLGLILCCLLLATAYYAQYITGLEPCPLCILQRIFLFGLAFIFLVAGLHNPNKKGTIIYTIFLVILAWLGAAVAGRQIWLEMQPVKPNDICLPGFGYIFSLLPSGKAWDLLFTGTASCAKINWTFFGVSIAVWTFISFILLSALAVWTIWQKR